MCEIFQQAVLEGDDGIVVDCVRIELRINIARL